MKPLGGKCYNSIGHLRGSRVGTGDHFICGGQAKLLLENTRDRHDEVIVQEKLDGTNVGIAMIRGQLVPLMRAGYEAISSPFEQHRLFAKWVYGNYSMFEWLPEGYRICGEWLLQVHSVEYDIDCVNKLFCAFDLIDEKNQKISYSFFSFLCDRFGINTAPLLHRGGACSIEKVEQELGVYGHYGAKTPVEGAVWRLERKENVNVMGKYVRKSFEPGIGLESVRWQEGAGVNGQKGLWAFLDKFANTMNGLA